jgi:hypothetical protein
VGILGCHWLLLIGLQNGVSLRYLKTLHADQIRAPNQIVDGAVI